jgi:hypothetical protein
MLDLLGMQKYFILQHLAPGDTAVDFTMGNGHDTEFLCRTVGESGRVFAFDIQEQAINSTRQHLSECGCPQVYTLIHDSHHNVKKYIFEPIKAGMFNLGWLPGGDKSITTLRETTLPAVEAAISLLAPDGIVCVAVYPGHAEGDAEGKLICEYLSALPRWQFCATQIKILNSPTSPYFIIIEKKQSSSSAAK